MFPYICLYDHPLPAAAAPPSVRGTFPLFIPLLTWKGTRKIQARGRSSHDGLSVLITYLRPLYYFWLYRTTCDRNCDVISLHFVHKKFTYQDSYVGFVCFVWLCTHFYTYFVQTRSFYCHFFAYSSSSSFILRMVSAPVLIQPLSCAKGINSRKLRRTPCSLTVK